MSQRGMKRPTSQAVEEGEEGEIERESSTTFTAFVKGAAPAAVVQQLFEGCAIEGVRQPRRGKTARQTFFYVDFIDATSLQRAIDRDGAKTDAGETVRISRERTQAAAKPAALKGGHARVAPPPAPPRAGASAPRRDGAAGGSASSANATESLPPATRRRGRAAAVTADNFIIGPVDQTVEDVSKELISTLPSYELSQATRVLVCNTRSEAAAAVRQLRDQVASGLVDVTALREGRRCSALGFDTETKPTFRKGEAQNKVALIQIAGRDLIALFRLSLFDAEDEAHHDGGIPQELRALLEDPDVLKVGVGVAQDTKSLRARVSDFDARGSFFDVEQLVRKRFPGLRRCGLRGVVASVAGRRLSKAQQCANWEQLKYSPPMTKYAATDAAAGLLILDVVLSEQPPPHAFRKP
ncbi:ribonuclease H-like domain-containing protein [Pelagophyceae sp. CCMP2097]|nr:ribonuclease H-like domain-containing protein [Pelagophyceae sp. CCMP2097]